MKPQCADACGTCDWKPRGELSSTEPRPGVQFVFVGHLSRVQSVFVRHSSRVQSVFVGHSSDV